MKKMERKNHINTLTFMLSIIFIFAFGITVKAENLAKSQNTSDEAVFVQGNKQYFIDGDDLIKVELQEVRPVLKSSTYSLGEGTTEVVKDQEVVAEISSREISEEDKNILRSGPTTGWVTRSDQAMNNMQNIKITLSVVYADNSNEIFTDGYYLNLKSASGTWTRIGGIEGVYPQKSKLYWVAAGIVHDPFGGTKRGSYGFTRNYNTPTFSNVKLMPDGYFVDPASAGVVYTLYCTRSVTIDCRMPFFLFG